MLVTTTHSDSPGRARSSVACTRAQPTEKFTYYGKPRCSEGVKRGWITSSSPDWREVGVDGLAAGAA